MMKLVDKLFQTYRDFKAFTELDSSYADLGCKLKHISMRHNSFVYNDKLYKSMAFF